MKKSSTRISANELNRFMYCPNQWYYKRVYGAKSLTQMYEALDIEHSEHTEHFTKGMKHHTSYHFRYRIMKVIRIIILIGLLILIFKGVSIWK
ncbi:hypothetical protein PBV87_08175 [Niameybacter massiliensis]|uniref:PD-(D/E)XK endonuclease-like domain-containing protein n=1 Tax=Holtiella tumoricola TaxID=3018743 RepID=A0AA42DLR7_9FIRM|nr:hypothetical protein [Holtiella tumoricola]MDA3731452.1 hypothetical protein [Holtiella tumoricola]